MAQKETLHMRIDEQLKDKVFAIAKERGIPAATFIKQTLQEKVDEIESKGGN